MKKLFSCQFGSRLYGTQTPTSDVDWKHVVLPDLNDLLLCKRIENNVKKTNTEKNTRNTVDDVDEEFIPLQVFARDFMAGQTYAIELAFSIDSVHAQQTFHDMGKFTQSQFVPFVRELRARFLTSNIKAMMGYVVNQASLYSFKGERLNAVKLVREYLEDHLEEHAGDRLSDLYPGNDSYVTMLPDMLNSVLRLYPKYFKLEFYDVGGGDMRPCFKLLEKTLPHSDRLSHALKTVMALENKYGSRAADASESNVDWKATMHALRIVDEGLDLLQFKKLSFPFKPGYVSHLLQIKRGELPLDPIKDELARKLDLLKDLEKTTELPAVTPELAAEFELWLVEWLRKFYSI